MLYDLEYLSVPLPEDVLKQKNYGDFKGATATIDSFLKRDIPDALKQRLRIEKEILKMIGINEYPYSWEQAQKMMQDALADYDTSELQNLKEAGLVDWIYIDGEPHFQRRFLQTLIKTQKDYQERAIQTEDNNGTEQARQNQLNENIRLMKEKGSRKVKTRVKGSIKVKKEYERVGEKVKVYLPVPQACQQLSEIKIISTSPEAAFIAPEDTEQRTVCFETVLEENQEFSVEYSYINQLNYVELDPAQAEPITNDSFLEEELPHIQFTPYLEKLLAELLEGETNPIIQARKIYDFITTKVNYSFMREYFTIENISEYAAVNLKGDCGVQAILFITLCRMAKIPAKWQSGLYVSEYYTGCHDWAQFYVAPYGWVFADLSFGGSAYRMNNLDRWNYYFGNLDIFRMPANSAIQKNFVPEKNTLRADPIDNQRGEFEYEGEGLPYAYLEVTQEMIEMIDLD
ncbi:transglutaminase-like domain-containing protein [Vagococcus elongatus]|uniref:Transglutaminase n=1 Tax=Vagococcus elongatus TaxID=180344 RepID=A0A430B5E1_9ENTE|nr:transglutaminase-like domain-containing protein [Vagococcus elongatus]RSU15518.1 transglutaminase [Vagococcus elongatus]